VDFNLAVKAFIVKDDKLLIIKRSETDPHKPGIWELPGGRLAPAEDPREGLAREVKEEVGIDIEAKEPVSVEHFTRDDGQKITMLVFNARPFSEKVRLGNEHSQYEWVPLDKSKTKLSSWWHSNVDEYIKLKDVLS